MKKYKKRKKKNNLLYSLLIITITIIYSLYANELEYTFGLDPTTEKTFTTFSNKEDNLSVYFLDVGQADSILIQVNNENMLIDAGNNNDGPLLVNYFNSLNIKDFKYVVGTHPHEDHIGGLDNIIESFNIEQFFLPNVITTTTTFLEILDALETKNMKLTVPKIGQILTLGDAKIEVLYTGTNQKDLNSTSIVLKLTYHNIKFLFTGDTTATIEKELAKKEIQTDVLKVSHHGSPYSTTSTFLKKASPKYAIISVGKQNNYGHPGTTTLNKLKKANIEIHRTDKEGTIIATTNGKTIKFTNEKTNVNGG